MPIPREKCPTCSRLMTLIKHSLKADNKEIFHLVIRWCCLKGQHGVEHEMSYPLKDPRESTK